MTGAQQHKDMRNELQQTELESCTVHLSVHLSVYPSLSLSLSLSLYVCMYAGPDNCLSIGEIITQTHNISVAGLMPV